MPDFRLRPKARVDLDEIWEYTTETWGAQQAERYLRNSSRDFELLAENPEARANL